MTREQIFWLCTPLWLPALPIFVAWLVVKAVCGVGYEVVVTWWEYRKAVRG